MLEVEHIAAERITVRDEHTLVAANTPGPTEHDATEHDDPTKRGGTDRIWRDPTEHNATRPNTTRRSDQARRGPTEYDGTRPNTARPDQARRS
ncbi:hypothetical protein [Nocardia anaemiae]|uniref:hypothetical protein n=1 Tax=Nocardia anaemiae TaxID=263910 RepID=UPI0007A3A2B5|nr:hypothetical protein [Nocardia anaemiae]